MYYETQMIKSFVKSKMRFSFLFYLSCGSLCLSQLYRPAYSTFTHFLSLFSINTAYTIFFFFFWIKWYPLLGSRPKGIAVSLWVAMSRLMGKRLSLYGHFPIITQAIPLWVGYFLNIQISECILYGKMQLQNSYGCLLFWNGRCA